MTDLRLIADTDGIWTQRLPQRARLFDVSCRVQVAVTAQSMRHCVMWDKESIGAHSTPGFVFSREEAGRLMRSFRIR